MHILKIFLLLFLLSSCGDENKNSDQIVVGMSMDFPPFEFIQNGKPAGFEVDLINEVGQILNKKIKFIDIDFSGIIGNLNAGKIDVGISGFNITDERKKSVDFIDCYYYPKIASLHHKNITINTEDDLKNKRIGVQTGTTMEIYLKKLQKKYPSMTIKSLTKNTLLIQELKLNRIDSLILENNQAIEFTRINPELFTYSIFEENNNECYSMIFKYKSNLKEPISNAIKQLEASGRLKEIENKWL